MLLIENVPGGNGGCGGGGNDHGIGDKDNGGDRDSRHGIALAIFCCNPSEMPQTHNKAVYFIK